MKLTNNNLRISKCYANVLIALMFGMGLSACGGGGGSDIVFPPPPAPKPADDNAADLALKPGAEIPPSLDKPQSGSTVEVGVIGEGIYRKDTQGIVSTFVDRDYFLAHRVPDAGTLWATLKVASTHWELGGAFQFFDPVFEPVTGVGSFIDKTSMSGQFSNLKLDKLQDIGPVYYSPANALAVSQDSVTGEWTNRPLVNTFGVHIVVAPDGSFTGNTEGSVIGVCGLKGKLGLLEPKSAKNMYAIQFRASNTAQSGQESCKLHSGRNSKYEYHGRAAIDFLPAGQHSSNGAYRYLSILAATKTGSWLDLQLFRPEVMAALPSN